MGAQTHISPNTNPKQEFVQSCLCFLPCCRGLQLENSTLIKELPPPRRALALLLQTLQRWRLSCRGSGVSWRASPASSGGIAGEDEHNSPFHQRCSASCPLLRPAGEGFLCWGTEGFHALGRSLTWMCPCLLSCRTEPPFGASPDFVYMQSSAAPKGSLVLFLLLPTTEYYFMHLMEYKAITECKGLRKYKKICLEL